MSQNFCILSFDGGGVGGLFSCRVLERLMRDYPPLMDHARVFAGTSTGGLIALALAGGVSIDRLIDLYRTRSRAIFATGLFRSMNPLSARHDNDVLKREVQAVVGGARLADLARRVVVPTFRLHAPADPARPRHWGPKVFHNFPSSDSDGAELVLDVAMRTSAAPTYFPSYQGFVDGGVFANNPSMTAIGQALDPRNTDPLDRPPLDRIVLLSVGTLTTLRTIEGDRLDRGALPWAKDVINILLGGTSSTPDFYARALLGTTHYRRVDVFTDRDSELDDASDSNLRFIEEQVGRVDFGGVLNFLRSAWF